MKLHRYTIGTEVYGSDGNRYGENKGRFPDMETAKKQLIMAHPFPAVMTGRYSGAFIPGISLEGRRDDEVIQLWSSQPGAVENSCAKFDKLYPKVMGRRSHHDVWPHDGDGTMMGLVCEIHVSEIAELQKPVIAGLLMNGDDTFASASPAGRMAMSFSPANRANLQLRLMQTVLAGSVMDGRLGDAMEQMQQKLAHFNEGMRLMNAYVSPTAGLQQMRRGDRAPSEQPYCLFQTRLYLEDELGLIANRAEMDWRDMKDIDRWIMASGRWTKLLPLPKCILVTQICKDAKRYEKMNPFEAAYHNAFNMETLVWVRDGDNVWRFATDCSFDERIFPAGDDMPELLRLFQEAIWYRSWKPEEKEEGSSFRTSGKSVESKLDKKNMAAEEEPIPVRWTDERTYKTVQAWLDSEDYDKALDEYLRKTASEKARYYQRKRMPFAVSLQGIIDNQQVFNIPKGTDVFGENAPRYLKLIDDFTGGITDPKYTKQFAAMTKATALKPGDRIIGYRPGIYRDADDFKAGPYASRRAKWNHGQRGDGPFLFTVHHVEPATGKGSWEREKIFVHERVLKAVWNRRRWGVDGRKDESPFMKGKMGENYLWPADEWLPIDLPVALAEALLDDRVFKKEHKFAVPVLAQWEKIKEAAKLAPAGIVPFLLPLKDKPSEHPEDDE